MCPQTFRREVPSGFLGRGALRLVGESPLDLKGEECPHNCTFQNFRRYLIIFFFSINHLWIVSWIIYTTIFSGKFFCDWTLPRRLETNQVISIAWTKIPRYLVLEGAVKIYPYKQSVPNNLLKGCSFSVFREGVGSDGLLRGESW